MLASLEWANVQQRESGMLEEWWSGADKGIRQVSGECQGLLLEQLAVVADHCDKECVDFLRQGAPFYGELPCSGIGKPVSKCEGPAQWELQDECATHNGALLSSLCEDPQADALMRCVAEDAKTGRMTAPILASKADLGQVSLECCLAFPICALQF